MKNEKRFATSLLGFNKKNVNIFIMETLKGFETELQNKNSEILKLKNINRDIQVKNDNIPKLEAQIKSLESEVSSKIKEIEKLNVEQKTLVEQLKLKTREFSFEQETMSRDRERITEVLMLAQEKATSIIDEARKKTDTELDRRYRLLNKEREEFYELKSQISQFREDAGKTFRTIEGLIGNLAQFDYDQTSEMQNEYNKGSITYLKTTVK